MDLYRLTIQDSQDTMQFDLLDAPIKIEDVEGAVDNTVLTGDIFTDYLFLKKRWEQKWAIMCKDEYERLRGFYTRQWSLATVPSVKVTQGYLENTSWEGQIFYINTPYGGEIDSMSRMTGDASQVAYSTKNLYPYPITLPLSILSSGSGSSATTTGDSITVTNQAGTTDGYAPNISASSQKQSNDMYIILPTNTDVTLSFKTDRSTGIKLLIYGYNQGNNNHTNLGTVTTNSKTFNTGSRTNFILRFGNTIADSSITYSEIMVELGSSPSSFEPYIGIQTPNPQFPQAIRTVTGEQTISINGTDFKINLGKNLFDKDNASLLSAYINGSGSIASGTATRSAYLRIEPNTTYTIQKTNSGTNQRFCVFTTNEPPAVGVQTLQVVGTRSGADTSDSYTITTDPNANWLGIFFRVNTTTPTESEILETIQVEEGSTKTDYASYFAPYRLANIDSAQDSIYFNGSDWIYRQEVGADTRDIQVNGISGNNSSDTTVSAKGAFCVLKSALGWTPDYDTTLGVAKISSNLGRYKLDTSVTGNASAENMQDGTFCQRQGTNDRCYFRATSLIGKTGAEVKAILANQGGVNAWWALATPTETTITDATLISQLNAIQAALQEGQNTVAVTANGSNLPAKTITLNGIAGREKPVLAQTNVRIGLSDGGVLNACECRQNVTLSMRETA